MSELTCTVPAVATLPPAARRGQGATDGMALACHKGHATPKLHVQIWDRGVKVKRPGGQPQQLKNEKRGTISGLSRKARQRLLWCAENTPELRCQGLMFVTLTYPGEWPKDGRQVKRHLDTFGKRTRRFGGYFLWVLEYQTRGAPHFHLLAKYPDEWNLEKVREWVAGSWYEVVGSGDERHLKAGTGVEEVKNPQAAGYYVSSYSGKWEQKRIPEGVSLPGKMWGMVGCRTPKPQILCFNEGDLEGVQLVRIIRRAAASDFAFHQRCRVISDKERQNKTMEFTAKGLEFVFKNKEYFHTLSHPGEKGPIPVFARVAWHPRDPGRGAGFSVRNVATTICRYIERKRLLN